MLKKGVFFVLFFLYSTGFAKEVGAVASGHPLATEAGLDVLKKGGNAFDAAIAISTTLNVVEPAMTGLGGYGTTLIYDAQKKEVCYLNSSGKFPLKTNSDLMRAPTIDYLKNRKGPKSISTPGNLNAWKEIHTQYGKLAWSELFEHAICYAKNGFPVSPYIARLIAESFNQFSDYSKSFYGKEGRPLKEGERLIQKDLAKTLELVASQGVDPFYRGEIALLIDRQMREQASFLSIEDLRGDVAEWHAPLMLNYKGYDVYTMGNPGNGFAALFILGVMDKFSLPQHNSPQYLHILAEVLKESCKARLTQSGNSDILTAENFVSVANSIDKKKASPFVLHTDHEGMNTTHFVVADQWGNIVSSTQTLGYSFGSNVMIEGTGIWMNNSMAFCTFEPKGNPMDAFPGKYKLSSNSPIIILKEDLPWVAFGTPGGHTIPQNVAQIILNLIDFQMTMQEAIDVPKIAFFEEERALCTEEGIPDRVLSSLMRRGHFIDNEHIATYLGINKKIGNAMGIKLYHGKGGTCFEIGVDRRKDGWSTTHILD